MGVRVEGASVRVCVCVCAGLTPLAEENWNVAYPCGNRELQNGFPKVLDMSR